MRQPKRRCSPSLLKTGLIEPDPENCDFQHICHASRAGEYTDVWNFRYLETLQAVRTAGTIPAGQKAIAIGSA
jgi:hypothetical protein